MCEIYCKNCKHLFRVSKIKTVCRGEPRPQYYTDPVDGVKCTIWYGETNPRVRNKKLDCKFYSPTLIKRFKELF